MSRGDESTLAMAMLCLVSDDWMVTEMCGVRLATSHIIHPNRDQSISRSIGGNVDQPTSMMVRVRG